MSAQTDLAAVLAYEAGLRDGLERAAKIADTDGAKYQVVKFVRNSGAKGV